MGAALASQGLAILIFATHSLFTQINAAGQYQAARQYDASLSSSGYG
jgi:hypothetical protein